MNHIEIVEILPAFALDCLEPDEKRQVSEHLAACPDCQAELRAYLDTAASLALAVPELQPPARVKRAILARIQPAEARPGLGERLQRWWRGLSPAWGLAGLVVLVVLVASNIILWQQVQSLAHQPAAVSEFQLVHMSGTTTQPGANGVMVIPDQGMSGTLTVDGLAQLPGEKQYQLWLVKDGKRISGGVFSVDEWGYAAVVIRAPLPLMNYTSFGITIEPTGGSPGPTGPKVMGSKT